MEQTKYKTAHHTLKRSTEETAKTRAGLRHYSLKSRRCIPVQASASKERTSQTQFTFTQTSMTANQRGLAKKPFKTMFLVI